MTPSLEVILSPAELPGLTATNPQERVCVVFDILRASTSMITALAAGAAGIIPVAEIAEALAWRERQPDVLLAGERNGLRIPASLTGGVAFDLGNSPREFASDKVQGRTIVMTTSNGTRALRACAGSARVLVGSFLNLRATCQWLQENRPPRLVLVCSGTFDQPALEDIIAAGAVCEKLWPYYAGGQTADSAEIARRLYPLMQPNLLEAMKYCRNGRRLLSDPELRDDVWLCVQRETASFVAELCADGVVRRQTPPG